MDRFRARKRVHGVLHPALGLSWGLLTGGGKPVNYSIIFLCLYDVDSADLFSIQSNNAEISRERGYRLKHQLIEARLEISQLPLSPLQEEAKKKDWWQFWKWYVFSSP